MFVYFIFYDDYDIHDIDNDHQNVVKLQISKSEEILNMKMRRRGGISPPNEVCSLCLEEIVTSKEVTGTAENTNTNTNTNNLLTNRSLFIFRDYSIYNYNNSEYIHTCDCRPSMHSICFIDTFNNKHACIICSAEIKWRYSSYVKAKAKVLSIMRMFLLHGLYFSINLSIIFYVFIIAFNFASTLM